MSGKYDVWLAASKRELFATDGTMSRVEWWFRRQNPEEFQRDVCELVACYPYGSPADTTALAEIWCVFENALVQETRTDVPESEVPEIVGTTGVNVWPNSQGVRFTRITESGQPGVSGAPTSRWYRHHRVFVEGVDYVSVDGDNEFLPTAMTLAAIQRIAGRLNRDLNRKLTKLVREIGSTDARILAEFAKLQPMDKNPAAPLIAEVIGRAPSYVRKRLQKLGG